MKPEKVGLGIVGLGGWASGIIRMLMQSNTIEIKTGFSLDEGEMKWFRERTGVTPAKSYKDMLADPGVEAVAVLTANHVHRTLAVAAARAKKHVMIEKPIANTLKDAFAIHNECKKNRVKLAVGHNSRRMWPIRKIKEFYENGVLGKVSLVETNFSHAGAMRTTPQQWRWYKKSCPTGPLIQLGVHHIDSVQSIFGPISEVSAMFGNLIAPTEAEDLTSIIYRFKSGIQGYNGSSYTPKPGGRTFIVYGTKATASVEAGGVLVGSEIRPRETKMERYNYPSERPDPVGMREQYDEFARAIRGKAKIEVTGKEAIRALAVVEAAALSNRTKKVVKTTDVIKKYGRL